MPSFDFIIKSQLRWFLLALFLSTLIILNQLSLLNSKTTKAENLVIQNAEVLYVPNLNIIKTITLNYTQAAADLLWLRTISYFAKHFNHDRKYKWLEYFIEQIIALDPNFKKVYHWAGANVLYGRRFTTENVKRSNHFYQLALKQFPNDYEAAYRLGLNFYVEMKTRDPEERRHFKETGLSYLEMAANSPDAPEMMRSLVASISQKLGKHQIALQYLIEQYINTDNPMEKQSLAMRIRSLKDSDQESAKMAEQFSITWKENFPYLSPMLFTLIGSNKVQDINWRKMIPDVDLSVN